MGRGAGDVEISSSQVIVYLLHYSFHLHKLPRVTRTAISGFAALSHPEDLQDGNN